MRAIEHLINFFDDNPNSNDLIQGPLVYDDGNLSTHWSQTTPPGLWGTWGYDRRSETDIFFEIPMQGLGIFAMKKDQWPGFNPLFTGFGGEEGYIHEKVRQLGGRALCLSGLRWRHWFRDTKSPVPYPLRLADHVWNLLIGHRELGVEGAEAAIYKDFGKNLELGVFDALVSGAAEAQEFGKVNSVRTPSILGIWYTNNSAPRKLLVDSLRSIETARSTSRAQVDISTSVWDHIPEEQFPSNDLQTSRGIIRSHSYSGAAETGYS